MTKNPEKARERQRRYRETNRKKLRERQLRWREANREKLREASQRYREIHPEKALKAVKQWAATQISGSKFRLAHGLRCRLRAAFNKNVKTGSAVRDLGCSIEEFKTHIEKQWSPGMTWKNWTKNGWHLDHIKPLASFDLTNREQLLEACHYSNYQPLWAKDNLRKGKRENV